MLSRLRFNDFPGQHKYLSNYNYMTNTITMSNQRQQQNEIDLEHLRALVEEIQEDMKTLSQKIDEVVSYISGESGPPKKKFLLLKQIHEEGDAVTKERFNDIGRELGYDIRGLQGLFSWGGRYVTRIAGNKIALTEKGIDALRKRGLIE